MSHRACQDPVVRKPFSSDELCTQTHTFTRRFYKILPYRIVLQVKSTSVYYLDKSGKIGSAPIPPVQKNSRSDWHQRGDP